MDLIPTWVRTLWDTWDLRVLVLLSFTLQIILSLFGSRRKYISSVWISVLVWSAYLMADWVATVALGKLSDVQGNSEKSNLLWAIWAPLLLLHLGGPDTITAYSLEDNQLWLRHLLGLVVQISVAIYVILMSWKNSWFLYMSLPALVAGMIKYGERTWVLKSVRDDKYLHRIPLGDLRDKYSTEGHDYVRVLVVAHDHLRNFLNYLVEGGGLSAVRYPYPHWGNMETNILWDAVEVQMGLMYDLIYTKATVIYSRRGIILRCISLGCTVTVLLGLIFRIILLKTRGKDGDSDEENWHEIDIAITGVLTVGALVLEIYAAIVTFSSNWMMLWLIKHSRGDWVIWLSQRFPCLFKKKKNWSQMMGQFDLLGYCLKLTEPDFQTPSRKIIRSVFGRNYEDKWNRYQHKTAYSIPPLVYNAILELSDPRTDNRLVTNIARDGSTGIINLVRSYRRNEFQNFSEVIQSMHVATKICYHLEMEGDVGSEDDPSGSDSLLWKKNKKVSKVLSDYMMYLLIMHPSLLPNVGSLRSLEKDLYNPKCLIGDARDVDAACRYWLSRSERKHWRTIVEDLKGKTKPRRWEIIKLTWLRLLHEATRDEKGYCQKNSHLQQLKEGGELLTLIWFIKPPYSTTAEI